MWKFSFYIALLSILLFGCAQVVPLTGGKRDTSAPKITVSFPVNKSLNFSGDNITIKFDEFVQLKDLANQFIISPSLKTKPVVQSIGKSVIINFNKEELEKNTTYRLYFGNSIVDMHEGNPLKNYEFVFSTGSHLDTMSQQGEILDALFKEPETDMIVGLYSANSYSDSTIYKQVPQYYCKTNPNGQFNFTYLPDTSFKLVAFNDKNKNLIYDAEVEKIAFKNDLLKPGRDSLIKVFSFFEKPRKTYVKKTQLVGIGKVLMVFNKPIVPLIKAIDAITLLNPKKNNKSDSILIYYWPNKDTIRLKVSDFQTDFIDTIKIVTTNTAKKTSKFSISSNVINGQLKIGSKLHLLFPGAIDSSQSHLSKIIAYAKKDSLKIPLLIKYKYIDPVTLELESNFENEKEYILIADTGAFKNRFGLLNDSLKIAFKLQSSTSVGQIKLNLLFNKKQHYTIELVNTVNKVVDQTNLYFALSESNYKSIRFKNITPGTYKLRIIFDDDENKEWSTGHFLKQLQPERVEIFSKELKVISDWEIEEDVILKK